MGLIIGIVLIGGLLFVIACVWAIISSEVDSTKIKNEREAFADDCNFNFSKTFSVQLTRFAFYCGDIEMHNYHETSTAKYDLYINFRVLRAVLVVKQFPNGVLTSVDVYKKSGSGDFRHYWQYSRKDYIEDLINNGYNFNIPSKNELYSGIYRNQENRVSTEGFIRFATAFPAVRWCEDSDFLKEFAED